MPQGNAVNNIILRIKIQKMVKIWKKKVKKSKHRLNVLKEWYQTQKAYIKDIQLIKQQIEKPLLDAELINSQQDRILFPNLDSMLALSNSILQGIGEFIKNWHPNQTMIGEDLINFHKGFIIYRQYCENYYKGEKIIGNLKKQSKYQKIQSKLPMDIPSYIIKPVQRPPKYQLLLRQYQKAIREDHPDFRFLSEAIEKYRQVNEENNQSMDEQIRRARMADLDHKFGGVVSVTRNFLYEEDAKSIDFKVKLYVLTDLILVAKVISQDKEEGYKKIFLDARSFVDAPMDGKYFLNKLFICGQKQNIHLNFFSVSARQKMLKTVSDIIYKLHKRQNNRQSVKKKTKIKMNVFRFQQLKIKAQPQLRITVVGVQKRPVSPMNYETVYILKIQAPFPINIFQYSYVSLTLLAQLEQNIKNRYKNISLPILNDAPESMSFYDVKKNKTKIIEYREIYIERYLNFIIRSQELENQLELIAKKLKINDQLWQVVSSAQACTCDLCLTSNQSTFDAYLEQQVQIRSIVFSNARSSMSSQASNRFSSISQASINSNMSKMSEGMCAFNSFMKASKLIDTPNKHLNSLSRRLMWVDCKMGRIDYLSLPKNNNEEKIIKVPIHFLSLKEDQKTYVWINSGTTVHEVIQQIAQTHKIETLRDFGLFINYKDFPRLIDRDEKLLDILKNAEIGFQTDDGQNKNQPEVRNNNSVWERLNILKKWGEQMIGSKKSKICLRKYIFVIPQLERKACLENPQRYSILIEQVFYRLKHQVLILNKRDLKKLCALYYILTNFQKIPHLTQGKFQIEKLKQLIPDSKWHSYTSYRDFERDIFMQIKQYWEMFQNSSERKSQSGIFDKLTILYNCVMSLVHNVIGWNTLFFQVTNYDPPTLPGNQTNLLLGINRENLIIIRKHQIAPLIQIPISKLDYKVTVFSIFIETSERILRFDGQMMYDIKKMIEIYRNLATKFSGEEE